MTDDEGEFVPPAEYLAFLEEAGLADCLVPGIGELIVGFEIVGRTDLDRLGGPVFRSSRIVDSLFNRAEFGRFEATNTTFQRCSFFKSSLWLSVILEDAVFEDCNLMRCGFRGGGAVISKTRFVRCNLRKTSFLGANLTDVVFEDCLFHDTFFDDASLERVTVIKPDVQGTTWVKGLVVEGDPDSHPFSELTTEPPL